MNILVLGHKGLIGSSLFFKLQSIGFNVLSVNDISAYSDKYDFYQTSRDGFIELLRTVHVVIYAISDFSPSTCPDLGTTLYSKRRTTFSVFLSVIHEFGIKLYYCSSGGAVYGSLERKKFFTEDDKTLPISNYGQLKDDYEKLVIDVLSVDNNYCIFRISNIFSYLQYFNVNQGIVGVFTRRIINDDVVEIYSNGESLRDYISLSDAILLISRIIELNGVGIFNISSSVGLKTKDLFDFISVQLNKPHYDKVLIQEEHYGSPKSVVLSNYKIFAYLNIDNFFSEEYLMNQIREEVKMMVNERRP